MTFVKSEIYSINLNFSKTKMLIKLRVSLMAESAISTSCVRSFDMIENGLQIFNLEGPLDSCILSVATG